MTTGHRATDRQTQATISRELKLEAACGHSISACSIVHIGVYKGDITHALPSIDPWVPWPGRRVVGGGGRAPPPKKESVPVSLGASRGEAAGAAAAAAAAWLAGSCAGLRLAARTVELQQCGMMMSREQERRVAQCVPRSSTPNNTGAFKATRIPPLGEEEEGGEEREKEERKKEEMRGRRRGRRRSRGRREEGGEEEGEERKEETRGRRGGRRRR
ncbi:unnamed protein product [Pleuronectes platessa]|uniref:Uncharacterized protein n=1 Tax=Pleuronectes platessa TaxID=8262 RepID=A0A9N7V5Q5_PLEPL|nr:unnamed protein product [Pleuronectes platessa]